MNLVRLKISNGCRKAC
jgi:hypothetical protein